MAPECMRSRLEVARAVMVVGLLLLAGSRPSDPLLDPFAESGTTLAVTNRLARRLLGIGLKPIHARMARARVFAT